MRLRQKLVDGEVGAVGVDALAVQVGDVLVLQDGAVVVLVRVLVDLRDVVVHQRLIVLLVGDVHVRPLDLRAVLDAVRSVLRAVRGWNADFWRQRRRRLRCGLQRLDRRRDVRQKCGGAGGDVDYRLVHAADVGRRRDLLINR